MFTFENFAAQVWKFRHSIVIGLSILFLALLPFAAKVTPDNSLEAISVANDPNIDMINKVETLFGSGDYITINFETKNILDANSLQLIDNLSQFLKTQPHIANVLSLTTISKIKNVTEGSDESLVVVPFLDTAWIKTGVPESEQKNLLNAPLYSHLIYNDAGTATALLAQLAPISGTGQEQELKKSTIINTIRAYADKVAADKGIKLHFFGNPVINRAIYETIEKEQNTLTPLMILAITLLISYLYRNLYITLVTLFQFLMTLGIVMGILGLMHVHLNWLTCFAPAVMIIMSICDAVYIINEFQRLDYSLPKWERLKIVYSNIGVPCLFTSITNGFGFASLMSSPIIPLQQYGLYVTIAVVLEFIISFTIFPLLLNTPRSAGKTVLKKQNPVLKSISTGIYNLVIHYPKSVALFCLALLVISCIGMTRLHADQYTIDFFKTDHAGLVAANHFFAKGAGGGVETELLIDSEIENTILEPEILKKIDAAATKVKDLIPAIHKTLSIVDYVKYFNQIWHNNDPAFYKIPDTRAEVSQLVFLMEMEQDKLNLRQFVNADYSKGIVRTYSRVGFTLTETLAAFATAEKAAKEVFAGSIPVWMTSKSLVACEVIHYLSETVVSSLLISVIFIGVAMMVLLRSVYVGLIALLPSVLPIFMIMGIMGYLGIWVNIATAMTFAVSLGIAMDDTINIMWRMRKNVVELGMDYESALKKVYDEIGVPLIGSSLLLAGGYMMLCFSQVILTTTFGILVALCCLLALVSDMFLTPLILIKLKPFRVSAKTVLPK